MKFKKYLGSFALLLTALLTTAGTASLFTVWVEEMPESMKKLR